MLYPSHMGFLEKWYRDAPFAEQRMQSKVCLPRFEGKAQRRVTASQIERVNRQAERVRRDVAPRTKRGSRVSCGRAVNARAMEGLGWYASEAGLRSEGA